MFDGFTNARVETGGARIHLRWGGEGTALLPSDGYPEIHALRRKFAPAPAARRQVICPDGCGYRGNPCSSKPPGEIDCGSSSKRAMAADQIAVMKELGFSRFLEP